MIRVNEDVKQKLRQLLKELLIWGGAILFLIGAGVVISKQTAFELNETGVKLSSD